MFEQLRQRLSGDNRSSRKEPIEIKTLTASEVGQLHLSWDSHFNAALLREHLAEFPGESFYTNPQHEFIIGQGWRRRDDVGEVLEMQARYSRVDLLQHLVKEYEARGYGAVVINNDEQTDKLSFYSHQGFGEVERIVYYEKPDMLVNFSYQGEEIDLRPYDKSMLTTLLEVDHASFPWLWWNGLKELEYYVAQPEVTVYLAHLQGSSQPIGYFGFTLFERWAHLDRLAVVPEVQARGVGAYQLSYALELMRNRGAKRCTLSTQSNNFRSQRLYEGFGYKRVRSLEYSIMGKWLKPKQELDSFFKQAT